jgi:hypothetical protein
VTNLDLYTASGEFIRHCTSVAQAKETIHQLKPGARSMRLSADRSQIHIRFPGSRKDYTYMLRPASDPGARQYWEIRTRSGRLDHGTGTQAQVQAFFAGIHDAGEYLRIPVERLTLFAVSEPANRFRVAAASRMDDLAQGATRARAKAGISPKGAR